MTHAVNIMHTKNTQIVSLCEQHIAKQEVLHNIPKNLLKAISLVESGRAINKQMVAWPWTINVEGKGYIFSSKQEAIKAVKDLQKLGIKSIDVGCMQINLKHHPNAFISLEDAFDPQKNVTYAAHFLNSLYAKNNDWLEAIGHYHSHTPKLYKDYQNKVITRLKKISKIHPASNNKFKTLVHEQSQFNLNDVKNGKISPVKKITTRNINKKYKTIMKKTFIPLSATTNEAKHYIALDNNLQSRTFIPLG